MLELCDAFASPNGLDSRVQAGLSELAR